MSRDIEQLLSEYRARVNQRLRDLMSMLEGCPPPLLEAVEYSLLAPGKRLRPVLTMLAAEATGGKADDALSAGCAVEMVHAYSLVHDDLPAMDDDDLRRGLPTAHKKFGEALAILAGDALLTLAFEVVATGYPAAIAAPMCRELTHAAGGTQMIGGQVNDLVWDGKISGPKLSQNVDGLCTIHAAKTGALFSACMRLGLMAAKGERPDPRVDEAMTLFARSLGLAFQITDDLLDVEGDESRIGKRVGKDADRGKPTFPGLLGIEESRRRVESLIKQAQEALRPLDGRGEVLAAVARMVAKRDR